MSKMKSKVYIGTSLDGFIARKDGDFSWLSQFANDEAIKAYVLSTSIKEVPDSVKEKAVILSMKPKDLLLYLSGLGILNIYIDGGLVIQNFLKEDLVDELIIAKVPILIGSGISLFGYLDIDLQFRHIRTQIQTNGLVRSYYERIRK